MRRRFPGGLSTLLLLVLAIAGCEVSSKGPNDRDEPEGARTMLPASEVDSIGRMVRAQFIDRFALGGSDTTLASMYTPDAIFTDQTGRTYRATEIRQAYGAMAPGSRIELNSYGAIGSGDLVVDIGRYVVSFDAPAGQQGSAPGQYMIALQRLSDGSWKIVRQMTSATPPTTPAPAPFTTSPAPSGFDTAQ